MSHPRKKAHLVATNANSFFKPLESEIKTPSCVQNVNVEVNIDQKDDCTTGCFKALIACFGKAAAS